jgi:hypothetical protein
MSDLDSLINSKISLISHQDARYDGTLFSINTTDSSIVLKDGNLFETTTLIIFDIFQRNFFFQNSSVFRNRRPCQRCIQESSSEYEDNCICYLLRSRN